MTAPSCVGIQGGPGSFNEAAWRSFGRPESRVRYYPDTPAVLAALRAGDIDHAQFAVLSAGEEVAETAAALVRHVAAGASLRVVRTYEMETPYALLGAPGDDTPVRLVAGHPTALKDSRADLAALAPQARLEGHVDPLPVAERLARGELPPGTAVLGCAELARLLPLAVVVPSVTPVPPRTRFALASL